MKEKLLRKAARKNTERRRRRRWNRFVQMLSCFVVFCTVYMMILPAVTLEAETFCGKEEHTHTEACCLQTAETEPSVETAAPHEHTDSCYGQSQALICTVVMEEHAHDETCTQTARNLTCGLEETEGHVHNEECGTIEESLICGLTEAEPHTHGEGCSEERLVLSCGQEEAEGHSHGDACHTTQSSLSCTLPEDENHTHGPECSTESTVLTCGQEELAGHAHEDGCYTGETVLVCTLPEGEGHAHTQECRTPKMVYTCGQEAREAHSHTDACYTETVSHTCTPAHVHGEDCYRTEAVLICTEAAETQPEEQATEEQASEEEPVLICGFEEEHVHTLICRSDPEADVETAEIWERTLPEEWGESWPENLLAAAASQLDYQESRRNYAVTEDGTIQGYTRYGAWYGDPYGDWNAMFVSFCLHYAKVPEELIAPSGDSAELMEQLEELELLYPSEENPWPGDIIFFDTDEDGIADRTAIVSGVNEDIEVIEGDHENAVQLVSYELMDETILGYGVLPAYIPGTLEEPVEAGSEEGEPVPLGDDDPYNLANYVTGVTVQHKAPGADEWVDVDEHGNVQSGDALLFWIAYSIDAKTLSTSNRTVTYTLPITATKEEIGDVYNGTAIVGTYKITENKIEIEFTEEYAASNASGMPITGQIAFESSVSNVETDSKGDGQITFNENIPIHITDKENNTGDLQVTKTAANLNVTGGTVDYTITVTSENGTRSAVSLTDVMTGIGLNGSIRGIERKYIEEDGSGSATEKSETIDVTAVNFTDNGNGKFTLTLPQMNANDSYTITYSAKIPDAEKLNGTVNASNTVDVESTDSEGGKLVDEASVPSTFERNLLSKAGELSADSSTVTWTIVVNTSKIDIGGWTLSDELNGTDFRGDVSISPAPAGSSGTVTLPYTFPSGSNQTYTITYTETLGAGGSLGTSRSRNTATLTPGNEGPGISVGTTVVTGNYNPLTKRDAGVVLNGGTENGNKLADYHWTVTIDATDGAIEPYAQTIDGISRTVWYYGDEIWDENRHWMTGAQLKEMKQSLETSLSGIGYNTERFEIIVYEWTAGEKGKYQNPISLDGVSDDAKFAQFRILFYESLVQGKSITFGYTSTGNVGDGTTSTTLQNWGTINGVTTSKDAQDYKPTVTKVDKESRNGGSETKHDIADTTTSKGDPRVLGWDVNVTLPDVDYTGDVIITEDIPYGTDLLASGKDWSLSFNLAGFSNEDFNFGGTDTATITKTVDGASYTVTAQRVKDSSQKTDSYVITVPEAMADHFRGETIAMEVRVQIDEDFNWDTVTKSFTNTVTVTTGNIELGEATQTQQIRNPAITKTGKVSNNTVPYSVMINPGGKDLLAGSDWLELSDVLSYDSDKGVNVTLIPGSVQVYKQETNGTETNITSQCPFNLLANEGSGTVTITISMRIPDSMPLRVVYEYRVTGPSGTKFNLSNSAMILEGSQTHIDEHENIMNVTIEQSTATAQLEGFTLTKVDAENFSIMLFGAEFKLQKWDGNAYVDVTGGNYTTGTDGSITVNGLEDDVAYRLVETKAPSGYIMNEIPYYEFCFKSSISAVLSIPSDFDGEYLNDGDEVMFANQKAYYELPSTGGVGAGGYALGGVLMLALGAVCLFLCKKQNKQVGI